MGKGKNQKLAEHWFSTHLPLLEDNFDLVGDDGKKEIEEHGLIRESDNIHTLWCSGRVGCEGMLVELKFLKRQDLIGVISHMMRPTSDQINIKVTMNKEEMDTFVFCVASKRMAVKLTKEMTDLSMYCPEKK